MGQAAVLFHEISRNWNATKPGATRVDKAVKGLGMVPSPLYAQHRDVESNPTLANDTCCKTALALTIALILALLD